MLPFQTCPACNVDPVEAGLTVCSACAVRGRAFRRDGNAAEALEAANPPPDTPTRQESAQGSLVVGCLAVWAGTVGAAFAAGFCLRGCA